MTAKVTLVINGKDIQRPRNSLTQEQQHLAPHVWATMMYQIAREYPCIHDIFALRLDQILWFYNGLRGELKRSYKAPK